MGCLTKKRRLRKHRLNICLFLLSLFLFTIYLSNGQLDLYMLSGRTQVYKQPPPHPRFHFKEDTAPEAKPEIKQEVIPETTKASKQKKTKPVNKNNFWNLDRLHLINNDNINKLDAPIAHPAYKNPCWYVGNSSRKEDDGASEDVPKWLENEAKMHGLHSPDTLHCLPYFMVTGFPRCGTRDLYARLAKHPQIEVNIIGTHWWTRGRYKGESVQSYLEHFQDEANSIKNSCIPVPEYGCYHHKITGDCSVSTMWDNDKWHQVLKDKGELDGGEVKVLNAEHVMHVMPNLRVIVLVRDPLDRLYSEYLSSHKNKSKPEDFHHRVYSSVSLMEECLAQKSERVCVYDYDFAKKFGVRLRIGMYSVYIKDWLKVLPRDQLFVIRLEDYRVNMPHELIHLFNFLEIEELPSESMDKIANMTIINKNKYKNTAIPMLPETRKILRKFYDPYIKELSTLLKDSSYIDKWIFEENT